MKKLIVVAILVQTILLSGCGMFGPKRDLNDPSNSLVIGYIDMDDAPTSISGGWVKQVAPPTEEPYWGLSADDGMLFNSYLPPGSYVLDSVMGSAFFKGKHEYGFSQQDAAVQIRISKPGIYFLGAFKYKTVKTGFFEAGKFNIERISHPTEAELLKRLLENNREIRNSVWGERIRARLAQLKS